MDNNSIDSYLCQLIDECKTLQELDSFIELWKIQKNYPHVLKRREVLASQLFQLLADSSDTNKTNEAANDRLNDIEEIISRETSENNSLNDRLNDIEEIISRETSENKSLNDRFDDIEEIIHRDCVETDSRKDNVDDNVGVSFILYSYNVNLCI